MILVSNKSYVIKCKWFGTVFSISIVEYLNSVCMLKRAVTKEPAEPSILSLLGVLTVLFSVLGAVVAGIFELCY